MDILPQSASYKDTKDFVDSLPYEYMKPCITLVRFGVIPRIRDTVLLSKIPEGLRSRLFTGVIFNEVFELSREGRIFFSVSTNPLLSSTLISIALARVPEQHILEDSWSRQFFKEFDCTQKVPRPATILWDTYFQRPDYRIVDSIQSERSYAFRDDLYFRLSRFKKEISNTRVWPYATSRGVSSETWKELVRSSSENNSHLDLDDETWLPRNSSRNIVRHFMHTGEWIPGRPELKQKWYPSGLLPRTYFCQGGDAIQASCYLRDFFNNLTDVFLPTNRYARVDGNRLLLQNEDGYFLIYDLTSFTSNFHEQKSFLTAVSRFFQGVEVNVVGEHLTLTRIDLGAAIQRYIDVVNDRPYFTIGETDIAAQVSFVSFQHLVAGFLGVPGNLASCTLGHGIYIGEVLHSVDGQACAGDDGAVAVEDSDHDRQTVRPRIKRLGDIQEEKYSTTRNSESASFLKRRFEQSRNRGILYDRIEAPSLAVANILDNDDPRFQGSVDREKCRESCAVSVCRYHRDLWTATHGEYYNMELEYLEAFLIDFYTRAKLPTDGLVRGVYGSGLSKESKSIHTSVVFPLSREYLTSDPDYRICQTLLPRVIQIPRYSSVDISFSILGKWTAGDSLTGRSNQALSKLVEFGFVIREKSEEMAFIDGKAKDYFRRILREDQKDIEYIFTPLQDLSQNILASLGLVDGVEYSARNVRKRRSILKRESYFDWDEPDPSKRRKLVSFHDE